MEKRSRRRRFIPDGCNHIYQKTENGKILFYDVEDYLVCYMIMSVMSKKQSVKIMELCFMVDHIHILIETDSREQMAKFMRDYSSVFIHEYNTSIGRHGQMFYKSYGNAPKKGDKKMRSTIVYIGNNPVEKKLSSGAEDYRWNFLKYMIDRNPFSKKSSKKSYSKKLVGAMKQVDRMVKSGRYINYQMLRGMYARISGDEAEVLTDYIIMSYYPFGENDIVGYYNDWNQMIDAMHSTSGSEYDIAERIYAGSDQVYLEMIKYVSSVLKIHPVRNVTVLPDNDKLRLASLLKTYTGATHFEVCKFLHIKY